MSDINNTNTVNTFLLRVKEYCANAVSDKTLKQSYEIKDAKERAYAKILVMSSKLYYSIDENHVAPINYNSYSGEEYDVTLNPKLKTADSGKRDTKDKKQKDKKPTTTKGQQAPKGKKKIVTMIDESGEMVG